MNTTTEIAADLSCRQAPSVIYAKQGDSASRFVKVRYYFSGVKFDMSQAARTEIRVQKPDGKITVNSGETADDGAVYPLTEQSLNVSGEASADFLLYGESGEVISCVPARLIIVATPSGDSAVESTNEYTVFTQQFSELSENFEELKKSYSSQIPDLYTKVSETTTNLTNFEATTNSGFSSISSQLSKNFAAIDRQLNGMTFKILSADDYAALDTPDTSTLYFVTDSDKVTMYLGSVKLSTGSVTAGVGVILADGTTDTYSRIAQEITETEG